MKVVAFNGSPKKDGNTAHMLKLVLSDLRKEGIDTEFVQVGGELISGCKRAARAGRTRTTNA